VPPFEQHAFISYAHIDNEALEPDQPGWVTRFHDALRTRLKQQLGDTEVRIWRDIKLAGNDEFAEEIVTQFPRTALLVSVVTPRYVKSEWCKKEVARFIDAAERSGGLRVGNKLRVVKVVKTPVGPITELPEVFQRTIGVAFYEPTDQGGREFDPVLGQAAREAFQDRVMSLAVQMADTLRALQGHAAGPRSGQVVYLAETGRDLADAREQLATDLRLHGHEVLPDEPLADDEDTLRRQVNAALARSTLAVHLVGASGGPVPDGPTGVSLVSLQNELAAERSRAARLPRLIWLPDAVQPQRPEHGQFIARLLAEAALQSGADLLRGELQALTAAVHGRLAPPPPPPPPPPPTPASAPIEAAGAAEAVVPEPGPTPESATPVADLHLVFTADERADMVPLIRALRGRGLRVSVPVFAGDAAVLRRQNTELATGARQVLLAYAQGSEAWKHHQLTDLRRQRALVGCQPVAPWLALLPPATPDKLLLQALAEPDTLDLLDGIDPAALAPLHPPPFAGPAGGAP
jgi:hypothetical protein